MLTALLTNSLPVASMYEGVARSMSRPQSAQVQSSVLASENSRPAALVSISKGALEQSRKGKPADEAASGKTLTEEEKKTVEEMKQRDREVRVHEQAHMAAAGGYAKGGPKFDYQRGPDDRQYAVGGSVNLDTSAESSPEATLQKAAVLRKAALAPASPSGQDRSVAAAAAQMESEARQEKTQASKPKNGQEDAVNIPSAYQKASTAASTPSRYSWTA